jgi:hypothetical protein
VRQEPGRVSGYGPDHDEIAINQNNLGALYQTRGEPARAEDWYRRFLRHHPSRPSIR